MGLIWRRTKRLDDDTDANLSKGGASLSRRVGRRLRGQQPWRRVVPAVQGHEWEVRTAPLSNT